MRTIVILIFAAFTAYSTWVLWNTSYWGAFPPFSDPNTTQIFWDLVCASSIALLAFGVRAMEQGKSLVPVVIASVGTLLLGSISLFLYVIWEKSLLESSNRLFQRS